MLRTYTVGNNRHFFIVLASSIVCDLQVPVLLEPYDAMKEAAKIQTHELWSSKGMLTRRSKDFPCEPLVKETIVSDNANGVVFDGWGRKVRTKKHNFSISFHRKSPKTLNLLKI
jgi:hypothetical protein